MAIPTRTVVGISAAVVGFGAGSAAAYWYLSRRAAPAPISTETAAAERSAAQALAAHPALKYGMPASDSIRVLTNFVIDFDTRLRNPKWVIEHFTAEKLQGDGTRNNSSFYEDQGLDPRFRSKLNDYRGSGYDRGHLAPAANHKASQKTMNETFVLSNTCPQVGAGFNRDMWARLERFVYELRDTCSDVYVVSGPLYLPQRRAPGGRFVMQHDMIGVPPQLVAVPTHFYKVVLGEVRPASGGSPAQLAVGAFVMPNQPIEPDAPLASFVVPISALEEVSGTKFFPKYLNHDERRAALDQASLAIQRQGQAELRKLRPGGSEPALLPAPEGAAALLPPPRGVALDGHGAVHLCEHKACRLPPPNWWEAGKKKPAKLRRTKSSPAL